MRDLTPQPSIAQIPRRPHARQRPEFRVHVLSDDEVVLDLAPDTADDAEFGLRAAVGLAFIECLLVDLVLELRRHGCAREDAVLAPAEVGFEGEFPNGEGEDERFPGDGGVVEEVREAVEVVHLGLCVSCVEEVLIDVFPNL